MLATIAVEIESEILHGASPAAAAIWDDVLGRAVFRVLKHESRIPGQDPLEYFRLREDASELKAEIVSIIAQQFSAVGALDAVGFVNNNAASRTADGERHFDEAAEGSPNDDVTGRFGEDQHEAASAGAQ